MSNDIAPDEDTTVVFDAYRTHIDNEVTTPEQCDQWLWSEIAGVHKVYQSWGDPSNEQAAMEAAALVAVEYGI